MKLTLAQLKLLASGLYYYFHNCDKPPADHIFVPVEAIKRDPEADEDNVYLATVKFIVEYCGRKAHTVRIRFKVDAKGKFMTHSWSYA